MKIMYKMEGESKTAGRKETRLACKAYKAEALWFEYTVPRESSLSESTKTFKSNKKLYYHQLQDGIYIFIIHK